LRSSVPNDRALRTADTLLKAASRADNTLDPWLRETEMAPLAPLLSAADEVLEPVVTDGGNLNAKARRDLVRILGKRLRRLVEITLFVERERFGAVPENSIDAWANRFARYPALGNLTMCAVEQWLAFVRELLERLRTDAALLADFVDFGRAPILAGVRGDLGDVHDEGRSVTILEFEGGSRVVYKPKDLRVTHAFGRLVDWLNRRCLSESLRVPEIVVRGKYAWEEHVPFRPCHSEEEVAQFYRRIGMFLRLFQVLEARDLWLDNLVAHGSHPVFVDYEMLLHPRRRLGTPSFPAAVAAQYVLDESVVGTGVVILPTTVGIGRPSEDLGALTPVREFRSPFVSLVSGPHEQTGVSFSTFTRDEYAPVLHGQAVRADRYVGEIVAGYRTMHEALRANAGRLLEENGPIAAFAGLPVRYIYRHTWACSRIIRGSTTPDLMIAADSRREFLSNLLLASGDDALEEPARTIVRDEIDCFDRLDIPYLLCRTDGVDLFTGERPLVRDLFEKNALARACERLARIDAFPLEEHVALLLSALSTGPHRSYATNIRETKTTTTANWLEVAIELGDLILSAAYKGERGWAWLGLCRDPFYSRREIKVLPPDILSGSAGLAIALAELFGASRETRFREGAFAALASTRAEVDAHSGRSQRMQRAEQSPHGPPFEAGAFVGVGAQLYALIRCGRVLSHPGLVAEAEKLAASLPLDRIAKLSTLDVATGSCGLLLSLLASGTTTKLEQTALELAVILQRRIEQLSIEQQSIPSAPYPDGELVIRIAPDVRDGLKLAVRRMDRISNPLARWAHVEIEKKPTCGGILTMLALASEGSAGIDKKVRRLVRECEQSPTGWLEGLELAVTAARRFGAGMTARAEHFAGALLGRKLATGRWFSDRLSADVHDLSAVTGLAALLNALVGLHDPQNFRSIRLVE
jgi:type 2 lantibiotic biosynthesis protein LanM